MINDDAFSWSRAWVPRGGTYSLDPTGGYVAEPSHWLWGIEQTNLLDLSRLRNTPVAALLGDPGLGKTHCARAEADAEASSAWIDALHYPNDIATAVAAVNIDATHGTTLYIDNLDISRLGPEAVVAQVLDYVRQLPVDSPGLRVRFVCRSARWPTELDDLMRQRIGLPAQYPVAFELLPLTGTQVREAANDRLGDELVEAFMGALEARSVMALAARPITLAFLLDEYAEHGDLPTSRADLYLNACHRLCRDESSARLRSATTTRTTDARTRLDIAQALAALSVICGAARLKLGHGEAPGILHTHDLAESDYFRGKGWSAIEIQDTVDTGLFTLGGNEEFQWSHPTFAEFLCARWVEATMSRRQVDEVFLHAGDGPTRVVPQLVDAATWLSGAFPAMFHVLLDQHTLPLLRSDTQVLRDDVKLAIVDALFEWANGPSLGHLGRHDRSLLKNLTCSPLAERVQSMLQPDTHLGPLEVALDFVVACELTELASDVEAVLLDPSHTLRARVAAGYVYEWMSDLPRPDVRPVLEGDLSADTDDELRGICLTIAAPALTLAEITPYLTLRRNESLLGAYQSFLYGFDKVLRREDAQPALAWVRSNQSTDLHEALEDAEEQVIQWAFTTIETADEADELTALVTERVLQHHHLIRCPHHDTGEHADPEYLRNMTPAAWGALCNVVETIPVENIYYYSSANPSIMPTSAFERMVVRATETGHPNWLAFVRDFYRHDDTAQRALLEAAGGDLAQIVEQGDAMVERQQVFDARRAERDRRRLDERIQRIQQGLAIEDTTSAWAVVSLLGSQHRRDDYLLSEADVWREMSNELRDATLDLAERFVRQHHPPARDWIGARHFPTDILAGYAALLTLQVQRPDALDALPAEVLERWAAEVMFAARFNGEPSRVVSHELLSRFVNVTGVPTLHIDRTCSDDPNNQCSLALTLMGLERVWPVETRAALVDRLDRFESCARCQYDAMKWVALHDAGDDAVEQIVVAAHAHPALSAATVAGALWSTDPHAWTRIRAYLGSDDDRQREVAVLAVDDIERHLDKFLARHDPTDLFDLWCWLAGLAAEHERRPGANWVAVPEDADRIRNGIATLLANSGDPTSVTLLRRMAQHSPDQEAYLLRLEAAAQVAADRQSWEPTTIDNLLMLALSEANRLVATAKQLRDVVADEILDVAHGLQADRSLLEELWIESNGTHRPVDEVTWCHHLVEAMRRRLTERRIVANREPQLRIGEELDILAETISLGEPPVALRSITEAKGCWHADVETAHTTQLAGRYMRDLVTHGIYLVFWTYCDSWDTTDYRRRNTRALRNRIRQALGADDHDDDIDLVQRYLTERIRQDVPPEYDVVCIVVDGRLTTP